MPLQRTVGEEPPSNLAAGPTARGDMPDDMPKTELEEMLRPLIGWARFERDETNGRQDVCTREEETARLKRSRLDPGRYA